MSSMQTITDNRKVFKLLKQFKGKWVRNLYSRTGAMVHSRVSDLRKKGHVIQCHRFGSHDYRYKLVAEAMKSQAA